MPDPLDPEGVLPNVLRWLDRSGQAGRNAIRGDLGAAARQLADFVLEPIDAAIPFIDAIPNISKKEDYVSGSELVGLDEDAPWWQKVPTDIGVGLATDPLTYLTFGAVPAAKAALQTAGAASKAKYGVGVGLPFTGGKYRTMVGEFDQPIDPLSLATRGADAAIAKGLGKVDDLTKSTSVAGAQPDKFARGYEDLKAWMRRATGSEKISPEVRRKMAEAAAEGGIASKYWTQEVTSKLGGLDQEERVLLTMANLGIDLGTLKPTRQINAPVQVIGDDFQKNIQTLAATYGKDATKLQKAAADVSDMGQRQYDEAFGKQAFYKTPGQNQDYMQRQWIVDNPDAPEVAGSLSQALKERKLKTPEDVAKFLSGGDVGLELDATRLMLNRATQQGRMLSQAKLAKEYAPGSTSSLADDLRAQAMEGIKTAGLHRDEAKALEDMINGLPPRGDVLGALSKMTRPVKGAMVYGVVLPKFGSLVRNKLGMGFQAGATEGVRDEAFTHLNPVNVVREMGKAWDEAYGTSLFGKADDLSQDIKFIEDAYKNAKNTDGVITNLAARPDLQEAVRNGVMDGFVSTEEILSKIGRDPKFQKFWDIYQAPGVMFQYLEQRGRLQTYKNLLARGNKPSDAARLTSDALFNYQINSAENRALRDVVPFAQFMAKAIPQQAKWLSTRPAAGVAAAPLFYDQSGDEPPVYPWMQGRSRIPMGDDAEGNQTYLTGFGLPMESLDVIPNISGDIRSFGRGVQKGLLASTAPVLKTATAVATGEDPYFGTPFGTYDKIPFVGNAGSAGRLYNMAAGTGFLEPLGAGMVRQASNLSDEDKPMEARALDFATGAKLATVDPDVAERQAITQFLENRPDVKQYRTFYQPEGEPDFEELMRQLQEAKKRIRDKQKAAKEAAAATVL